MESSIFSIPSPCHALATIITLLFLCLSKISLAAKTEPNAEFIKSSCGYTLYPDICYRTLSSYANTIQTSPMELANASLIVSLKCAESTSAKVLKLSRRHGLSQREAGAISDCIENMRDSVDELHQSLVAMRDLEGPEFAMQMGNIQTSVSAALTDEDTCMDGFEDRRMKGKIKGIIRSYVVRVAQLTSNALALISRLSTS